MDENKDLLNGGEEDANDGADKAADGGSTQNGGAEAAHDGDGGMSEVIKQYVDRAVAERFGGTKSAPSKVVAGERDPFLTGLFK